jgi:phosphosulfolactate synthase
VTPTPEPDGAAARLGLTLPARTSKQGGRPREHGLTMMIDGGMPLGLFTDVVESSGDLVDLVKLGWATSVVTEPLARRKVDVLRAVGGIDWYLGGTLLERVLLEEGTLVARLSAFAAFCDDLGCAVVEVSDGTVELTAETKAAAVAWLSQRFTVITEVGAKDQGRAEQQSAQDWVAAIRADLDAGAAHVITESRESGRSGIAGSDGRVRDDVVEAITAAGIDPDRLLFEAPTRALQLHFLALFGADANLGNIAHDDLVGLETLRLGLRSDTLLRLAPRTAPPVP